jgi:ATP-dependent Clp protease adaptor protein ClpS
MHGTLHVQGRLRAQIGGRSKTEGSTRRDGWYAKRPRRTRSDFGALASARYIWTGSPSSAAEQLAMTKTIVKPRTKTATKTQRPPLYKVILLNDDYTPREFVVLVLKAVFRMNEDQAYRVMMTAHQKGACVIAVYVRDVAETKAKEATDLGKQKGFPLFFTTEPEE